MILYPNHISQCLRQWDFRNISTFLNFSTVVPYNGSYLKDKSFSVAFSVSFPHHQLLLLVEYLRVQYWTRFFLVYRLFRGSIIWKHNVSFNLYADVTQLLKACNFLRLYDMALLYVPWSRLKTKGDRTFLDNTESTYKISCPLTSALHFPVYLFKLCWKRFFTYKYFCIVFVLL